MAETRTELVRRGYDAWNKGDRSWVLEHMSEDVEWVTPPEDPDPGTYRGYGGVEKFWSQWRAAVGQLNFQVEDIFESGDEVVVTALRSGRGEHSGLEVSDRVMQIFTFEGDKCVRVREFYDRAAALRSVGAEEADPDAPDPKATSPRSP
jgi:ketosteroid isomerase-like protein